MSMGEIFMVPPEMMHISSPEFKWFMRRWGKNLGAGWSEPVSIERDATRARSGRQLHGDGRARAPRGGRAHRPHPPGHDRGGRGDAQRLPAASAGRPAGARLCSGGPGLAALLLGLLRAERSRSRVRLPGLVVVRTRPLLLLGTRPAARRLSRAGGRGGSRDLPGGPALLADAPGAAVLRHVAGPERADHRVGHPPSPPRPLRLLRAAAARPEPDPRDDWRHGAVRAAR